jgi:hypothetical protein
MEAVPQIPLRPWQQASTDGPARLRAPRLSAFKTAASRGATRLESAHAGPAHAPPHPHRHHRPAPALPRPPPTPPQPTAHPPVGHDQLVPGAGGRVADHSGTQLHQVAHVVELQRQVQEGAEQWHGLPGDHPAQAPGGQSRIAQRGTAPPAGRHARRRGRAGGGGRRRVEARTCSPSPQQSRCTSQSWSRRPGRRAGPRPGGRSPAAPPAACAPARTRAQAGTRRWSAAARSLLAGGATRGPTVARAPRQQPTRQRPAARVRPLARLHPPAASPAAPPRRRPAAAG